MEFLLWQVPKVNKLSVLTKLRFFHMKWLVFVKILVMRNEHFSIFMWVIKFAVTNLNERIKYGVLNWMEIHQTNLKVTYWIIAAANLLSVDMI